MRSVIAFWIGVCLTNLAYAADSFSSEFSHFAGGVLMGGGTTWAVDRWWPEYNENRVLIGFAVGTLGGVIGEVHDSIRGSPKRFSVLDAASTALGAGVGAYATDRWILTPVVKKTDQGNRYYGFASQYTF